MPLENRHPWTWVLVVVLLSTALLGSGCTSLPSPSASSGSGVVSNQPESLAGLNTPPVLEFLGMTKIPPEDFEGTIVGGLSGLVFDPNHGHFYVISDDKADFGPPRFYTMALDIEDPTTPVATILGYSELRGLIRDDLGLDLEGIALDGHGGLYVSSEGWHGEREGVLSGLPPFIAHFDEEGRPLPMLAFGDAFLPDPLRGHGTRKNLGPEALSLDPDGRFLFAGFESSVVQDGDLASFYRGALSRLVRFDLETDRADQFLYPVSPLHGEPPVPGAFAVRGLVEIVAIDKDHLLAMERSFVMGLGTSVQIYWVDLTGADEVSSYDSVAGRELTAAAKVQLLDLSDLGIPLDNYEGLAIGPRLPDGRQSLMVVSDNNFNQELQSTWVLVLAVESGPPL